MFRAFLVFLMTRMKPVTYASFKTALAVGSDINIFNPVWNRLLRSIFLLKAEGSQPTWELLKVLDFVLPVSFMGSMAPKKTLAPHSCGIRKKS